MVVIIYLCTTAQRPNPNPTFSRHAWYASLHVYTLAFSPVHAPLVYKLLPFVEISTEILLTTTYNSVPNYSEHFYQILILKM